MKIDENKYIKNFKNIYIFKEKTKNRPLVYSGI